MRKFSKKEEQELIKAFKILEKLVPDKFEIKEIELNDKDGFNHIYYGPSTADGYFSDSIMWKADTKERRYKNAYLGSKR